MLAGLLFWLKDLYKEKKKASLYNVIYNIFLLITWQVKRNKTQEWSSGDKDLRDFY